MGSLGRAAAGPGSLKEWRVNGGTGPRKGEQEFMGENTYFLAPLPSPL